MTIKKFWLMIGLVIVIVAAIGFGAGVVYARGAFPALDRAVSDYGVLITDLREAIVEVEKKKGAVSGAEQRKDLDKTISEMEKHVQDLQQKQKEVDQWKQFLDNFFGPAGSDTPERRRP